MKRHGLNVREVSKDIEAGIDRVRELFKANKLKIHESCINFISELETYAYPEKKSEQNFKEIPIKENDHLCDSARYALFMHSGDETQEATTYIPDWSDSKISSTIPESKTHAGF